MKVVTLDPSGNWNEGNGTTGWAVFSGGKLEDFGAVEAQKYPSQEQYWFCISDLILANKPEIVICESYRLFAHKAQSQSWSAMETPQLIGYLRMVCWGAGIQFVFQDPSDKARVADSILEKLGYFEKKGNRYYCMGRLTNLHMRDAIRHGVFYHRWGKGKVT